MNSAAQVDQMVENWKKESWTKAELIVKTAEAELGWPYVWGAVGAQCTPSKRDYYANRSSCPDGEKKEIRAKCQVLSGKKSVCDGCTYYPNSARVLIDDCQGFVKQVMSRFGISFTGGGCTSMWGAAGNWTAKGPIKELPANQVCCVFMQNGSTMSHIGIHIGGGQIIHCSGTVKRGKTTDRGWTHYAIPKEMEGEVPVPTPTPGEDFPTLRKGAAGEYVTLLQTKLIQKGYDLVPYGADGKYGNKTMEAVKQFQRDNGLQVDGITGRNTWAAIMSGEAILYTVIVKHVSRRVADDIVGTYGGEMTKEG